METKQVVSIKTRKSEDEKVAKVTALTIDFTGATPEQIAALATAQIKIRAQAHFRKHGIPAAYTVKVAELSATGMGLSAEQMETAVLSAVATDPAKLAEMLAKLQAMQKAAQPPKK